MEAYLPAFCVLCLRGLEGNTLCCLFVVFSCIQHAGAILYVMRVMVTDLARWCPFCFYVLI